ncbi:hypothetical protein ACIGO9_30760 [Nocardia asteroides]|uniref:hypothetical protein n=1 Tax=Nocardia asteroides TaxID=1824 RepID=UPI0037C50774
MNPTAPAPIHGQARARTRPEASVQQCDSPRPRSGPTGGADPVGTMVDVLITGLRAQERSRRVGAPLIGPHSTTSLQLAGRFDIEALAAVVLNAIPALSAPVPTP